MTFTAVVNQYRFEPQKHFTSITKIPQSSDILTRAVVVGNWNEKFIKINYSCKLQQVLFVAFTTIAILTGVTKKVSSIYLERCKCQMQLNEINWMLNIYLQGEQHWCRFLVMTVNYERNFLNFWWRGRSNISLS